MPKPRIKPEKIPKKPKLKATATATRAVSGKRGLYGVIGVESGVIIVIAILLGAGFLAIAPAAPTSQGPCLSSFTMGSNDFGVQSGGAVNNSYKIFGIMIIGASLTPKMVDLIRTNQINNSANFTAYIQAHPDANITYAQVGLILLGTMEAINNMSVNPTQDITNQNTTLYEAGYYAPILISVGICDENMNPVYDYTFAPSNITDYSDMIAFINNFNPAFASNCTAGLSIIVNRLNLDTMQFECTVNGESHKFDAFT
jgi:hypothetical protein